MIILPRIEWTAELVRALPGADHYNDLPYYRTPPVGIKFVAINTNQSYLETDPRGLFLGEFNKSVSMGRSDIDYNLGVAGNVSGVWNLRGLTNKSSYSPDHSFNDAYVSVYILAGSREKPTDTLLRNIVDARRLVLSRYPTATNIVEFFGNPYLERLFERVEFWEAPHLVTEDEVEIPDYHLEPMTHNVHVQDLQDQLAFWGYYRTRVDGYYNPQTVDAVAHLQSDLKLGGYFQHYIDGFFTEKVRRAWLNFLEA